jgi:hypothetical protein
MKIAGLRYRSGVTPMTTFAQIPTVPDRSMEQIVPELQLSIDQLCFNRWGQDELLETMEVFKAHGLPTSTRPRKQHVALLQALRPDSGAICA